ncbi:MAG: SEL1-like repeat protein [Thiomargarita sp.]|nr:SEL1-like repeat protein [Thiomargarita sp.]
MANEKNTEQLGASIRHLLHPNQQGGGAQFGLGNTSQKVEIPQTIDSDKVKIKVEILQTIDSEKVKFDAKTIRRWRKLAKQGIADAQYNLGIAYYNGKGVKPDDEKAVYWYHKAAEHGFAEAQYNLGNAYHKGEGVKSDDEKAVYWLHKAAEHGIAEAQYNLGFAYHKGEGVKSDDEKAVYWLHKAAEQGDAQAQNNLGLVYYEGKDVKQDDEKTVYWLHKAAEHGYAEAQYNLGVVYYEGKAVKQDYEKAVDWYHKAAEQGYAPAQYNLGIAYDKGEGVEQDYEKAIYWYNEAAKQGDVKALYNLFKMNGGANIAAQFILAKIYDKQGDKEQEVLPLLCKVAAGLVSLDEEIDDKDKANFFTPSSDKEDINYLNKQITKGNIVAQVILAQLYKTGNGVQKDKQQAFSLFQTAAEQKDILAQYCLGLAYMEGQGVATNNEKAREQFQQIINQLKEKKEFSYLKFSFEKQDDTDKTPDYPRDIRQWIGLVARDKLSILHEKEAKQQLATANQELESFMAMIAHKFRGTLQNIEYDIEEGGNKKRSLDTVHTMRGLLNIFSVISTEPEHLHELLKRDRQGKGTILWVLEKSLIFAISQLLTIENVDKIKQHYFAYAKKTGKIPATTTRLAWYNDYFELEEQLQSEWKDNFNQLLNGATLDDIVTWMNERFFPIEIKGIMESPIHFDYYGTTASILTIVMVEILFNAVKYYASEIRTPLQLHWICEKDVCRFLCKNPSAVEERSGKGSGKGHHFLSIIANKLEGSFPKPPFQDNYVAEFSIPTHLLIEEP